MTPERLEMLRASLRRENAMPDSDLVLTAQPHDFEELFRLAQRGLLVENLAANKVKWTWLGVSCLACGGKWDNHDGYDAHECAAASKSVTFPGFIGPAPEKEHP
jgi:hypothetical protein